MFNKIYNILTEILGESRQGGYDRNTNQYQFNCPHCADENGSIPDGKYNLEINLYLGKYNCWKCGDIDGTRGRLSVLIKKYGNVTLYKEYKEEMKRLIESKLYDISLYEGVNKSVDEVYVKLPKTFRKIDMKKHQKGRIHDYLLKRNIDQRIIDRFNIGYTTWDEENYKLRNRIIIPSYDAFGDLNYWVGRDYTGRQKQKYMNCDADKKNIVFQESTINWDADIILVEGAIDCIYPINAIALLGKTLTRDCELYKTLIKKCKGRIIIALDADTDITETKRIYNMLNFGPLRDKIWYIRLDEYKDFGEVYETMGKRGIIQTLKKIKQFNEIELIF